MNIYLPSTKKPTSKLLPAPILPRVFAFLLDSILLLALSGILCGKWLLPMYFPREWALLMEFYMEHLQSGQLAWAAPTDELAKKITDMVIFLQTVLFIMWVGYFTLSESLLGGTSLGKKVFTLQVIQADIDALPSFTTTLLRSAFTASFFIAWPPMLILDALWAFFNADRKTGHDWLCRTRVVAGGVPVPKNKWAQEEEEEESF